MNRGAAQTLDDWARTVHWDGYTYWSRYIMTEAAHMGPNALPVPSIGNGNVDSNFYIGATEHLFFSKGDNTQSLFLYGNYCLVKDVISFDMSYIPIEFFQMSDTIKKQRHAYYTNYYDKKARGDVILNVNIRLLKKWDKKIQLALRIGYRYPSSNELQLARFTDGMGYYFDMSFGKPFKASSWKWIGMAGFYCWQVDTESFRQDDAFLFGTGLEWNHNGWKLQPYVAGYLGYIDHSGDMPILLRINAEKRFKKTSLLLRFQQGLLDYKYSSVEFGAKYFFK